MMSKVSLDKKRKFHPLLHEILWTARRYWWVAFVGFLLFFAFTFVATSLEGNRPDEFALIMRDSEVALRIAGVVYGLFASFVLFSFLWSRRESITYLSVGAARWKQFLLRYLFGFVSVALGIVIPVLVAYRMEMAAFGEDPYRITVQYVSVYLFSLVTLALLSYTVGTLVSVLCGSFLSALLTTVGVLAMPYAFLWGTQTMVGFYLFGTPLANSLLKDHLGAGLFTMLADQLPYKSFTSTALQPSTTAEGYGQGFLLEMARADLPTLPAVRMVLLFVLMAVLALLAGFAYCRRPAEHAGKATVHPILSHTVAIANGLCVAALVLKMNAPAEGALGTVILTALFIVALVVAAALLRWILIRDLRGVVKHYPIPCGAGALALVLTILLGMGWFGYSSYVPDATDVQSVTVTYNQNITLLRHIGQGSFSRGWADSQGATMSGFGDGETFYDFLYIYGFDLNEDSLPILTLPEDVETVRAIHEAIITEGRQTYTGKPADGFTDTVVPVYYKITYTLKSGKTVERYYPYLTLTALEETVKAEDTWGIREESAGALTDMGFIEGDTFEFGDPFFADFTAVSLSEEEREALAAALDMDLALQTSNARYFSKAEEDRVMGIIRVRMISGDSTIFGTHPHDRKYRTYYITSTWENTLAFVREKGLDAYFTADYTITDVRYQSYTPRFMLSSYGMGGSHVFFSCEDTIQIILPERFERNDLTAAVTRATDPVPTEQWDAWLEASRPVALMTRPGRMVQIFLTNGEGETRLVTRYIYEADIPAAD